MSLTAFVAHIQRSSHTYSADQLVRMVRGSSFNLGDVNVIRTLLLNTNLLATLFEILDEYVHFYDVELNTQILESNELTPEQKMRFIWAYTNSNFTIDGSHISYLYVNGFDNRYINLVITYSLSYEISFGNPNMNFVLNAIDMNTFAVCIFAIIGRKIYDDLFDITVPNRFINRRPDIPRDATADEIIRYEPGLVSIHDLTEIDTLELLKLIRAYINHGIIYNHHQAATVVSRKIEPGIFAYLIDMLR